MDPQLKPAPNPAKTIFYPLFIVPLFTNSFKTSGMDPALVFPVLLRLDRILLLGTSIRDATISNIL